jgi:hypothetical protein
MDVYHRLDFYSWLSIPKRRRTAAICASRSRLASPGGNWNDLSSSRRSSSLCRRLRRFGKRRSSIRRVVVRSWPVESETQHLRECHPARILPRLIRFNPLASLRFSTTVLPFAKNSYQWRLRALPRNESFLKRAQPPFDHPHTWFESSAGMLPTNDAGWPTYCITARIASTGNLRLAFRSSPVM